MKHVLHIIPHDSELLKHDKTAPYDTHEILYSIRHDSNVQIHILIDT